MKSFKLFIQEATPTVHANLPGAQGGFSSTGTNALGNAGFVGLLALIFIMYFFTCCDNGKCKN